jgi:hypothetical protein
MLDIIASDTTQINTNGASFVEFHLLNAFYYINMLYFCFPQSTAGKLQKHKKLRTRH